MDRRTDYKTALLIEAAIQTDAAARSTVTAARELARIGVPVDVAVRVLTRPAERRHPDPETDDAPGWARQGQPKSAR